MKHNQHVANGQRALCLLDSKQMKLYLHALLRRDGRKSSSFVCDFAAGFSVLTFKNTTYFCLLYIPALDVSGLVIYATYTAAQAPIPKEISVRVLNHSPAQ